MWLVAQILPAFGCNGSDGVGHQHCSGQCPLDIVVKSSSFHSVHAVWPSCGTENGAGWVQWRQTERLGENNFHFVERDKRSVNFGGKFVESLHWGGSPALFFPPMHCAMFGKRKRMLWLGFWTRLLSLWTKWKCTQTKPSTFLCCWQSQQATLFERATFNQRG